MSEIQTVESSDGPPKSRKVGGWADEKSRRKRDTVEEDERLRVTDEREDGDDEDLPVIPDLEAVEEEDLTTQVAAPPMLAINRLASYKQLDSNLQRPTFTLGADIDLQLLAKVLSPNDEVIEEDTSWEYDKLLAALSADIQRVWERRDQGNTSEQLQEKTSPAPS